MLRKAIIVLTAFMLACNLFGCSGRDKFMRTDDGKLYLNGKPFYEISFNKYDLFNIILSRKFTNSSENNIMYENVKKSLEMISRAGFKTIRTFFSSWDGNSLKSWFLNEENQLKYLEAIDETLDLCDQYGLLVVFVFMGGKAPFIADGESWFDLLEDGNSASRQIVNLYIDTIVNRYKNRTTIAMWELANEANLMADIGGADGLFQGGRTTKLDRVGKFHSEISSRIKEIDKNHLITTGDSAPRASGWHSFESGRMNTSLDNFDEQLKCLQMTHGSNNIDVISIHFYNYSHSFNVIKNNTGDTILNSPEYYNDLAIKMEKPLYIGEYGIIGYPKTRTDVWEKNPEWIVNFNDKNTYKLIKNSLEIIVDEGVPLTHWFSYRSDFSWDRNQSDFISPELNQEYFDLFIEANKRLQEKWSK